MYHGRYKLLMTAGLLLTALIFIRFLLPVLLPFLLGAGLALLAEPMTALLCRALRLPRGIASAVSVTVAFCFLTLILLLICALILRELRNLASILPDLELTAQNGMSMLSDWLLGLIHRLPDGIHTILERNITGFFSGGSELLDKAVRYVLGLASAILSHVPDSALMLGTAVISSFMISAKLPRIKLWFQEKFPKKRLQPLLDGLKRMRAAVGGWLKAQVKLSAVTWLILTLGFFLLRIPYAPLWAAAVSLVDAFPILGTGAILLPWSLLNFVQENAARGIGLLGIYAVVSVTRSVLEPKLVGKQLGLDPLLTLAALYAGYRLWGLGGMILAPLLAVTVRNLIPDSRTA